MKGRIFLSLLFATTVSLFAQTPDSVQRSALEKLNWWVGQWKGEAWNSTGSGGRDTTVMLETIKKDLDGTIIIVEGTGRRKLPGMEQGDIVHNALAVLSYDHVKKMYRWQAWRTPGGIYTESWPVVTENSFEWSMETPRGKMRYSIKLNGNGQWEELGEFSSDGQNWRPFFGMLLDRSK
jgi:hypothetical protein